MNMMTMVMKTVVMVTATTFCTAHTTSRAVHTDEFLHKYPDQEDYVGMDHSVLAVMGSPADLTCNITSPHLESAHLVLWYKSGVYKPVCSVDLRSNPPKHWINSSLLHSPATFLPANITLRLHQVTPKDQGSYRCEVIFPTSPTLTLTISLSVIVPPTQVKVYHLDAEASTTIGPLLVGDTLRLTCRVTGGSPPPTVTWLEGQTPLDTMSEVDTRVLVANTLLLTSLTKQDLFRILTCQAANSNLTTPLSTSVTLDVNFPPLWVRLRSSRGPVSVGREYVVVCQAAGARPSAVITWHLHHTNITALSSKVSDDGNVTTSELRLMPKIEDNRKTLYCEAHSPGIPSHTLTDEWRLDVYFVPRLTLTLPVGLDPHIQEGHDIYFDCFIFANPPVYKIDWFHEGKELQDNVSGGVIVVNQSLVLQRVSRAASGQYSCVAYNIEGDGHSNKVSLRVKYVPVCREGEPVYVTVARRKQVTLQCLLDAHPKPHSYHWSINNSHHQTPLLSLEHQQQYSYHWSINNSHHTGPPLQKVTEVDDDGVTLRYTPSRDSDYGTLLCWAVNSVGRQRRPCVFHILPAAEKEEKIPDQTSDKSEKEQPVVLLVVLSGLCLVLLIVCSVLIKVMCGRRWWQRQGSSVHPSTLLNDRITPLNSTSSKANDDKNPDVVPQPGPEDTT